MGRGRDEGGSEKLLPNISDKSSAPQLPCWGEQCWDELWGGTSSPPCCDKMETANHPMKIPHDRATLNVGALVSEGRQTQQQALILPAQLHASNASCGRLRFFTSPSNYLSSQPTVPLILAPTCARFLLLLLPANYSSTSIADGRTAPACLGRSRTRSFDVSRSYLSFDVLAPTCARYLLLLPSA